MKVDQKAPSALLGLDCGGTRSTAIYECGEIRLRAEGGAGNVRLLSDAQLLTLFRSLAEVHRGHPNPVCVCTGMAGVTMPGQHERILRAAAQVWPGAVCLPVMDLEAALAAAEIDGRAGEKGLAAVVIALSGTGSVFCGRNARGRFVRVGGWGHTVGDKGSGYEIGLRSLKAVLHYHDLDGKMPPLGRRLMSHLLLNEPKEIPEWALNASKRDIAALAKLVSAAAARGDAIARDILQGAAHTLAKDAVTCARRLAKKGARVKIHLCGSVLLKQPALARQVSRLIRERWPEAEVTPLRHDAAEGALEMARKEWATEQNSNSKLQTRKSRKHLTVELRTTVGPAGTTHWSEGLAMATSPTEQRNPRSMNLDKLPLAQAIELMLSEDAKLPPALLAERKGLERAIRLVVRSFKSGGRLIYVGAGTSGRLGVLDASECPPTFRTDPELVQGLIAGGHTALWRAAEGAEDQPEAGARAIEGRDVSRRDTVVGIAASGRTPFVWGALDEAKRRGAATVLVAMNPQLQIPRAHRPTVIIAPDIGPEILTGSTRLKSGTATKLILNMLTTLAMVQTGKVLSNLMVDVKATNVKLRDRAIRIVQTLSGAEREAAEQALVQTDWAIQKAVKRLGRK